MNRSAGEKSDLFARIDRWKQEVVKETLLQSSTQSRAQQYEPHHMKLRSRDTRQALAEVTGNPSLRKRKASVTMTDVSPRKYGKKAVIDENVEETVRRPGRGRPSKNRQANFLENEYAEQSVSRL